MSGVDELAVVNAGTLRTGPPLTGAEPQRDALLRAHLGWLVVDDGNEPPNVDAVFCIASELDEGFQIAVEDDEVFCIAFELDEGFQIAVEDDEVFCIAFELDDEVDL